MRFYCPKEKKTHKKQNIPKTDFLLCAQQDDPMM